MVEDLQRIYNEITGRTSASEIAAALILIAGSLLVALVVGWGLKRLLLRFSGVSLGAAVAAARASQSAIVLIGVAWALTVANVGPGFTVVIVIFIAIAAALIARAMVADITASLVLPYVVGDQIETHEHTGTVVDIGTAPNRDRDAGPTQGLRPQQRRSGESDRRLLGVRAAAFVARCVDRLPDRHHPGVLAARRCRLACRGRRPGSEPVRRPHVVRGWKVPARSQVVARPGTPDGGANPWSRRQHGQGCPRSSVYRGLAPSGDLPERVATGRDRRVSDVPVAVDVERFAVTRGPSDDQLDRRQVG